MSILARIRWPFLVAALVLALLALGVEIGSSFLPPAPLAGPALQSVKAEADAQLREQEELDSGDREEMIRDMVRQARQGPDKPPGRGVPYLGLIDALLVYSLGMITLALVIPERVQGRLQGIVSLILSIVLIIAAFVLAIIALIKLLIMVALFMAAPFGTLAYLALFGFFNRGGAAAAMSASTMLKLASIVCLFLAHQRFLQNKGLMLLYATSFVGNLLVAFLHALVPIVLVSITDAIAAIIVAILAIVWGIVVLIGAILAIVRAIV